MLGSLKTGVSFGLTSGIITTLGLMVGLHSGTHSTLAVIGGIVTIAVADALSDALGIHISEEAENVHSPAQVWTATISTFVSKLFMALSFAFPVMLFDLSTAMLVSLVWGLGLLCLISYLLAKEQGINPWHAIFEHLVIAVIVVAATHYLGHWVSKVFT